MFIIPSGLKDKFQQGDQDSDAIQLNSSHVLIKKDLVEDVFSDVQNVSLVYYSSKNKLMLAAEDDELFNSLHKTKKHMLKAKNASGDRSVAIHELLIDNDIDDSDRPLKFQYERDAKILLIEL